MPGKEGIGSENSVTILTITPNEYNKNVNMTTASPSIGSAILVYP